MGEGISLRIRIIVGAVCLFILAHSPGWAAPRSVKLRYVPDKKSRTFQIEIRTAIRQEVAGCPIDRAEWLVLAGRIQPESGGGSSWRVRAELAGIKGGVTTPFEELSFDTADRDHSAASLLRRYGLDGFQMSVEMSPAGPVRQAGAAFARPKSSGPRATDSEPNLRELMALLFGSGATDPRQGLLLASAFLGVLPEYPARSIRIGDSWETALWLSNGVVSLSGPARWRADAAGNRSCRLTVEATLGAEIQNETEINGRKTTRRVEISGSLRGEAEVSRRNGWPTRGGYRLDLSGRTYGGGLDTPFSMQVEIGYELGE